MDGDTQGVLPCLREERLKAYRKELPSLHSRLTSDALYKPLTDTAAMLIIYLTIIMLPLCYALDRGERNRNNNE